MITKKELKQLREVIRTISKPEQELYIYGKHAFCKWNGSKFEWTAPAGDKYILDASEVLLYVDKGQYVENYTFDLGEED